jgi:PKD repeat protein
VRESGPNEYIETQPSVRAAGLSDIELEWGEQHKFNGINSSAYKCDIIDYSWDFGDGIEEKGIAINHSYSQPGIYEVKLTVTSDIGGADSSTMKVTVGKTEGKLPVHNFPNPFNPDKDRITYIRYSISKAARVTIKIYDRGNNLVKKLIDNEPQEPKNRYYDIPWDGKNGQGKVVSNGVYFLVVETSEGERGIGKIAVIR